MIHVQEKDLKEESLEDLGASNIKVGEARDLPLVVKVPLQSAVGFGTKGEN